MLSYRELKPGTIFVMDGEPCEVLEYNFLRKQQRKPVVQTKIKNLLSGKITEKSFRQQDVLEEAEITRKEAVFIYSRQQEFWFHEPGNPKNRFLLSENIIGNKAKFLKTNVSVIINNFKDKPINISLPIKMDYIVKEAPPGERGNTAQGGTKTITLENGLEIQAPLFINPGDTIRLNTQTGQYTERVEKK
ncbi:MAG: hypothetical protein AAB926_00385 [Patescibacteria group bacterium]